jgi:hypothetical protein
MWKNVPPFKGKNDAQIKNVITAPLGKCLFGDKDDGKIAEKAYENLIAELDLCDDHYYTHIPMGTLATFPDKARDIERVTEDLRACVSSHAARKQEKLIDVSDDWANQHSLRAMAELFNNKGKKCTQRHTNQGNPRFSARVVSNLEEFLTSRSLGFHPSTDRRGFLAEEYILSFLNHNRMQCPECKVSGHLGSCGGSSDGDTCSGFRDGVCMNCEKKGNHTLFEIKTRWEKALVRDTARSGNLWVDAGNFVGLTALLAHNVKVYMVIVSRDTGTIRFGKIKDVTLRLCDIYCYNAQTEGRRCDTPGSRVLIKPAVLPVSMPPMDNWLSNDTAREVNREALNKVLSEI